MGSSYGYDDPGLLSDLELDELEELEELDGLAGKGARARRKLNRLRRRGFGTKLGPQVRRPGIQQLIQQPSRAMVPDLSAVSFPWSDVELLGLRPSGWSAAEYEQAIRNAVVSSPQYRLTARATFPAAAANETANAIFTAQNRYFLGLYMTYDQLDTSLSIVANMQQAEKFPLSGPQAVRLVTLLGAAAKPMPFIRLVVPNEPIVLNLVSEGAAPATPHNVDFSYIGWLIGGDILPGG